MSIYATLHTHPTCSPIPKPICITRGASAQLTYPLSDKTFSVEDIEQVVFMFKQGKDLWGYSMFDDSEPGKATKSPRFYILEEENHSAIIFNLDGEDTKQFKPGINLKYEITIKLNTDSLATTGYKDSIIIEPQCPIVVVDSLYSSL